MTFRNDIVLDLNVSPRLIWLLAPSVDLPMQDLHDTVASLMDQPWNKTYPRILFSEGKKSLDGGILSGITVLLDNAKVAFEARTIAVSTGVASSVSSDGTILEEIGATFISDGVKLGATVMNIDDGSVSYVREIQSEEILSLSRLGGGTENDWDIGDSYKVWNTIQCGLGGGNVVAIDANGDPMSPIQETPFTQVIKTSSSSATLVEQKSIQQSSYNNEILMDRDSPWTGILHPVGTGERPVNNLPDALLIGLERGLRKLHVLGDWEFGASDNIDGFVVEGESAANSTFTFIDGVSTVKSAFRRAILTGPLSGRVSVNDCHINGLTNFDGNMHDCLFEGHLTLKGNTGNIAHIINCQSGIPGGTTPIIDMDTTGCDLGIRGYRGGIQLSNLSTDREISVDLDPGQLIVDNTMSAGRIYLRGTGKLVNSSIGTTTINVDGFVSGEGITHGVDNIIRVIESQRGQHTATGNVYYWDPVNGDDSNDGLSITKAKLTWGGVNALVVSRNHDVIMIHPGQSESATVITEQIIIDKDYTFLRGPGRDIIFRPTATSGNTIKISGVGCELSGMRIETSATGTGNGLEVTSDFASIHDVWVEDVRSVGVRIHDVSYAKLKNIMVRNCLGNGIVFDGISASCNFNTLSDCQILTNGGDGVLFTGVNCTDNYIWGGEGGVSIQSNSGWGINEDGNANFNHVMGPAIHINSNILGETNITGADSGTKNVTQWAAWDALKIDHRITGSMGEAIGDMFDESFGKWVLDPIGNTLTLFKSDDVTVLKVFDLTIGTDDIPYYVGRTGQ